MQSIKEENILGLDLVIDPKTGEILSPLKWDQLSKRYIPASKKDLSVWELHIIEGSARLHQWANSKRFH